MELTFHNAIMMMRQYHGSQPSAFLIGKSQGKDTGSIHDPNSFAFAQQLVGMIQLRASDTSALISSLGLTAQQRENLSLEAIEQVQRKQLVRMMGAFDIKSSRNKEAMALTLTSFLKQGDDNISHAHWAQFLTEHNYDVVDILTPPEKKMRVTATMQENLLALLASLGISPEDLQAEAPQKAS
ncbi:MAG: hypothetical protein VX730_06920 [Pseudomonadota bacterium]|nr:hypothetical protein [Pseudomonadota bacterium]